MSALDIALGFIGLRWSPVPVPYKAKKPIIKRWHKLRITETDAPQYFNGKAENVGVILGPASQGLTDVDLDCAEAVAVAPCLLPRTAAIFGRESRRSPHWLYRTDLGNTRDKATIEYLDPLRPKREKATVAELRVGGGGKGAQTVFPGSTHETGEEIKWEEAGDPAEVDGDDLHRRVGRVAAAAILARHWPNGARHKAALAIGGLLAHGGWKQPDAKLFIEAVAKASGDPEWKDRVQAVADSFASREEGKKTTGLPTLAGLVDERVAKRAAEWLGLVTVDAYGFARRTRAGAAAGSGGQAATQESAGEIINQRQLPTYPISSQKIPLYTKLYLVIPKSIKAIYRTYLGTLPALLYCLSMRPKLFPTVLKVPADDDLRAALTRAAEAERTTVAEVARRALRAALAERPPATPPRPTRSAA